MKVSLLGAIFLFNCSYGQDFKRVLFLSLDKDCIFQSFRSKTDTLHIESYTVRLSQNGKWEYKIGLDKDGMLMKQPTLIAPFAILSMNINYKNNRQDNPPIIVKSNQILNRLSCAEIINCTSDSQSIREILDYFDKVYLISDDKNLTELEAKEITYRFNPRM
ncbi:hypothetical protein HUK80_10665 [Flavobacterium sp. MAH-1]|uniref:Uncharacterized protein n=1 Tax=Flavobacterium agri TaxID=2743471 RepID=A0A7Y8Y2H1_9FLAO|nr:hypothetical protein [Flavobacterium agri]NUY81360.1 hypothetical protein [Flavobacterium agri]NYA71384.1 hypothetical protein [Flavobacterium agri]